MTDFEFAWLIGILEGEGNFYLDPQRVHARVKVSMSDEDVISRVVTLMNASRVRSYIPSNPRDKRDRARMYEAAISGHVAIALMRQVQPFMGSRRTVAIQKVLDNWTPKLSGRGHCIACALAWKELHAS